MTSHPNNHNHHHSKNNHDRSNGHGDQDHSEPHEMMIRDFKIRFFVSLILSIPVLLFSPMIQSFFGFELAFHGKSYVIFGLSGIIYFYGGFPFLSGLYKELKEKSPGMMTLIELAITVAFVYSSAVVFGLQGKFFFWELVTLIDIMLLGHWIEMRSVMRASSALQELAKLMPDTAHKKTGEEIKDVPVNELKNQDIILIKPGEKIPADGTIKKGDSSINESMLTGESVPVEKSKGDQVIGGSINGDGSLEVEIEKTGEDTYLSKIIQMVKEAQQSTSKSQRLADKAALVLTIVAISVGGITLLVWLIIGKDFAFSMERMATVMVITCPHALGLAIPLVVAVSTSLSAKNGLLIKNRNAFENAKQISTLIFDKTGTLTEGQFGINRVQILDDSYNKEDIIQYAVSLEQNSEHPIAQGIVKYAKEKNITPQSTQEFKAVKGKGIEGKVGDQFVEVVSPAYLKEKDYNMEEDSQSEEGTTVFILIDHKLSGYIELKDNIRKQSYQAVEEIKELGIKVWMITGDNQKTAQAVSNELKLDGYFAEVLPDQKQNKIKELQKQKEFVAMTGDGINDAPALAAADIGIAIGSGTDVAAATADIILVNSDPKDVLTLIKFGQATRNKMIQNLFWATGYNVVAIPLAAGVLFSFGIVISPALGAVLMSISTIIVAINAKFLRVK